MSSHICACGRECKNAGGLASHQRSCVEAADAARIGSRQMSLLPSPGSTRGPVEIAAARDVSYLRLEDMIDDGVEALELTYVLLGREMDRAETDKDRYGKINTAAKIVTVRNQLAAFGPEVDGATLDEFWAQLSANVRDGAEP